MSGETSAQTASLKPRLIQVYLHVLKGQFHDPMQVQAIIQPNQFHCVSDSSQMSNLIYRRESYIFSSENPLTSSGNFCCQSFCVSHSFPKISVKGPNTSGTQYLPLVRPQIPFIGKEFFTTTPQSLKTNTNAEDLSSNLNYITQQINQLAIMLKSQQ